MALGQIKRALMSVYDKNGLIDFARDLTALGVDILASGGTARALGEAGIAHTPVEKFTGAKEVLGGRVKTLHPRIHAGILFDRRDSAHVAELQREGYEAIDLVVCNLYPFADVLAKTRDREMLIENIDVGGPTMLRAAAKNVLGGATVVVDPADYATVVGELKAQGLVSDHVRWNFAKKAFTHTANYDSLISQWFSEDSSEAVPELLPKFIRSAVLRYGENPHQKGYLYRAAQERYGIANGKLLCGKELSYNNYLDMDAAWRAAFILKAPGCAIVKHTNPCGLAQAASQKDAFLGALAGDPVAAFGGIIGLNTPLEEATALAIKDQKLFVECIVAPGFTSAAQQVLASRADLRLFEVANENPEPAFQSHRIGGGLLVETADSSVISKDQWQVVTRKQLAADWSNELYFAMQAAALLKSNAIAICKNQRLCGAGAGQMSRVDAVEQAVKKAGAHTQGAFLGSDAFFPFADGVLAAQKAGVAAIIQPGGSKRDAEVIAACDDHGIAMVFTGQRHFRH